MNQPAHLPSSAPVALPAALLALGGLAVALSLVGENTPVEQRFWAFLVPPVIALAASALHLRRAYNAVPGPLSLRRLFKSLAFICLLCGFAAGIFVVVWYRWIYPEVLESRMAEAASQMAEDGFSPGDIDEYLHKTRVVLYGPLGMFLGGILFSISALLPASLLLLFSRR